MIPALSYWISGYSTSNFCSNLEGVRQYHAHLGLKPHRHPSMGFSTDIVIAVSHIDISKVLKCLCLELNPQPSTQRLVSNIRRFKLPPKAVWPWPGSWNSNRYGPKGCGITRADVEEQLNSTSKTATTTSRSSGCRGARLSCEGLGVGVQEIDDSFLLHRLIQTLPSSVFCLGQFSCFLFRMAGAASTWSASDLFNCFRCGQWPARYWLACPDCAQNNPAGHRQRVALATIVYSQGTWRGARMRCLQVLPWRRMAPMSQMSSNRPILMQHLGQRKSQGLSWSVWRPKAWVSTSESWIASAQEQVSRHSSLEAVAGMEEECSMFATSLTVANCGLWFC